MSTSTTCVSGCTLRGRHVEGCPDLCRHAGTGRPCPKRCDGHCSGCEPRRAEVGELCAWCWQRLQADVAYAPTVVFHLRALAEPHAGARPPSDDNGGRGDPAFRSILSGAIDAADELHAALASWAHLVLEEHPDGHRMTGPDEQGTVRTSTTAVLDSEIAREHGTYLRRSTVEGIRDPAATYRLVAWLTPWLPWCAEQEWAGEMRRELGGIIGTTLARWPIVETRERAVAGVRCVRCSRETLVYTPTTFFRASFRVACSHPECGRVYTEAEFDGAVGRLAVRRGFVA